jgi:hypothetical protein
MGTAVSRGFWRVRAGVTLEMDRHLIDAFLESLTDILTDKVTQRLGLRPPVKATPRPLGEPPSPLSTTLPAGIASESPVNVPEYLTPQEAASLLRVSVKGLELTSARLPDGFPYAPEHAS